MRRRVASVLVAVMLVPLGQPVQADAAMSAGQTVSLASATLALGQIPPDVFDTASSATGSQSGSAAKTTVRHCRVTSVHDGDSMRVRCPGFRDTLRIRLDQIDAPELDQAYGTRSRDVLRSMCPKGGQAVVHELGKDTYNRVLGRVFCNDIDVNAAMVKAGAAWVYDYHDPDKSLYPLQDEARSRKRGLWAGSGKPVAPWDFRHRQRQNSR